MSSNKFNVRKATKGDCKEIFRLIKGLAEYEGKPSEVKISPEILERDGFETRCPPFFCLVIDDPESNEVIPKLMAYALCSRTYSTNEGRRYTLGDLFVSTDYRGQGLGKKLLVAVCKEAEKENIKTIRFNVLKTSPSLTFYKKFGIDNITQSGGWQYTAMNSDCIRRTAELY